MSRKRAIDSQVQEELEEVTALIEAGDCIDAARLRRWIASVHPEFHTVAFSLLFEGRYAVETLSEEETTAFFLRFLEQRIIEDVENDYCVGRHDAISYCTSWVTFLHSKRSRAAEETIKQIVEMLARICSQGDHYTCEAVLLVCLEHLFADSSIVTYFQGWSDAPGLKQMYVEALDLGEKWRDLE